MTRHIAAVVFGVLVLLAGCGSTGEQGTTSDSAPTTPSSAQPGVLGVPAKPDEATAVAYVADLEAIDPDIVHGKPDKAVSRGRDQCSSVAEWPDDQAKLVGLVQRRFISPDHPEGFDPDKSARILAVVRQYLCPSP
ncbi:hypothetical protein [Actinophytocola gossypii]|uniref:DUF732 domain-containing protein n=1 Tax=Actinophytocola gossypii TaxID=2812003 RepID=A0ABT2J9T4_9PSEU|nr:hypothetical protein [Actinophytocola gossypii]MCT2584624.1 hypothetical protein [Actinophytocola gossypii]